MTPQGNYQEAASGPWVYRVVWPHRFPPMAFLGVNVPAAIVVVVSIVIGLVMVLVFAYTSDQKAIHVAKAHLSAHLLALRLFQDQIHVVLRSYGRIILATGHYLRLALKPLLFVIVPVLVPVG